jgi:hypothetical protein
MPRKKREIQARSCEPLRSECLGDSGLHHIGIHSRYQSAGLVPNASKTGRRRVCPPRAARTYAQKHPRARVTAADGRFPVALLRFWPRWRNALGIVRPETVVRRHRKGSRLQWRSLSNPGPGRPRISADVREPIRRMETESSCHARRIQTELETLATRASSVTISRHLPKQEPDRDPRQRWMPFLRNHRDVLSATGFLVVSTVRFKLVYVCLVIAHGRREGVVTPSLSESPDAQPAGRSQPGPAGEYSPLPGPTRRSIFRRG